MANEDLGMAGLAWRFGVTVDGEQIALFTGCAGLDAEYEAFTWKEGGGDGPVVTLAGRLTYTNVKLTRPVDKDSAKVLRWFAAQASKPKPHHVTITLYDGNGAQIAAWALTDAWPVKYSGPTLTTLGEPAEAVALESLELSHRGFA
ncbi:phage tail protein [Actinocrinis puniceicyclus]|uniref:Phage tail protein n=1 Tax=Actinocrinis puniceicyclus TaxID=977794 RepID=A0A8J8BBG0_9ACTN|nr:phage tail protein [Actinocrinis puniceicyclus]MBS2964012.1 phage tail protein [Actinocrinis puniceicyclus]